MSGKGQPILRICLIPSLRLSRESFCSRSGNLKSECRIGERECGAESGLSNTHVPDHRCESIFLRCEAGLRILHMLLLIDHGQRCCETFSCLDLAEAKRRLEASTKQDEVRLFDLQSIKQADAKKCVISSSQSLSFMLEAESGLFAACREGKVVGEPNLPRRINPKYFCLVSAESHSRRI